MFSSAGDTMLDRLMGMGSTDLAAVQAGRNSLGSEIEATYLKLAHARVEMEAIEKRSVGAVAAIVETDRD